jgi:hypothetical protein
VQKPKYERPVSKTLTDVQAVQGICFSGSPEYSPVEPCLSGSEAIPDCQVGTWVYPIGGTHCEAGNYPQASCFSGTAAG